MSQIFPKMRQDIKGIFLLGASVFVGLSLYSYNPNDPSWNSIAPKGSINNFCGVAGSYLADALFQLFGFSSVLFVVYLFWTAISSFSLVSRKKERKWTVLWFALFLNVTSCLIYFFLPEGKFFNERLLTSGILGMSVSLFLIKIFNTIGAQIILWSLLSVLFLMVFEISFLDISLFFKNPFKRGKLFLLDLRKTGQKGYFFIQGFFNFFLRQVKTKHQKQNIKPMDPFIAEKTFFPLSREDLIEQKKIEQKKSSLAVQKKGRLEDESSDSENLIKKSEKDFLEKEKEKIKNKNTFLWTFPKTQLLNEIPSQRIKIEEKEIKKKAEILKNKLSQFSVTGEIVAMRSGPAVTLFEFKPDSNVKLSKITELADDLALALSSESLRIIAPIPGRDVVGIETSNSQRETVFLRELLEDELFWKKEMTLPIPLGKQVNGEIKIVDLRKMPHLMVAGTTGSGKSVFVVSLISSLIFKHSPQTLRLILVDPKQVDLVAFEKIPHLILPTVTDSKKAVSSLRWAVHEMEKRYFSMSVFGARNIESFNQIISELNEDEKNLHEKKNEELLQSHLSSKESYYFQPQPYIVIVIEEFGDLMSVDKLNVEHLVVRLAQKARACGIHLVLAMQSPRKEVVTGLIKSNIPGRISFKVSSSMDSRIILDETGGERLLAQGDMLLKSPGASQVMRYHGPYLKDSEIEDLSYFWSEQAEPDFDQEAIHLIEKASHSLSDDIWGVKDSADKTNLKESNDLSSEKYDEKYDEILSWASGMKEISASLIQRKFQLGYPRAARLIEFFEKEGIVSSANGSKPRQVLVNNLDHL